MTRCECYSPGAVDLYFYGELNPVERARFEGHLADCADCRRALDDLRTIRVALASRPDIAAPDGGDWTAFMVRLDQAARSDRAGRLSTAPANVVAFSRARSYASYLAIAALLALVTVSVFLAWRTHDRTRDVLAGGSPPAETIGAPAAATSQPQTADSAFATLSERHFERSKLVVLGLATKDPAATAAADWEYERELAGSLLSDTRLYRLAAEERGLSSIARVMQDLELVLLQASMSDKPNAGSLEQLQRLIRKRDLVTKMELVTNTAGI